VQGSPCDRLAGCGELRKLIEAASIAADPRAAQKRRTDKERDARVASWREPEGTMAIQAGGLNPAEAVSAEAAIQHRAQACKKAGMGGGMDQLRARAFTGKLTGKNPLGGDPAGTGTAAPGRVHLTAPEWILPLLTVLGLADNPGEAAGPGAIDPAAAGSGRDLGAFEASVRTHLARLGISVVPQYGVGGYRVDFAAAHPDDPSRMILAIEADGASYRDSGSVRDRDRLRKEHLERLGWRFHRLWSTSWFRDPDGELEKLHEAYERAVRETAGPPPEPSTDLAPRRPSSTSLRCAALDRRLRHCGSFLLGGTRRFISRRSRGCRWQPATGADARFARYARRLARGVGLGWVPGRAVLDEKRLLETLFVRSSRAARSLAQDRARLRDGQIIRLDDQDRTLWDTQQIDEGGALLRRAMARGSAGPYLLQAAIGDLYLHEPRDWRQIAALYQKLAQQTGSPIVEMNRAIAVAEIDGPDAGLAILEHLDLDHYRYFHSTWADHLRCAGRHSEVHQPYRRAPDLAQTEPEQRFLTDRLAETMPWAGG
jgi:very-short-patch-repair endonuclease